MKSLKDKVAVVTGAASGIGRELSKILAGEGCHLAVADKNAEGLLETAGVLETSGVQILSRQVDVSKTGEMDDFAAQVINRFKHVDIIINNAGIAVVALIDQTNTPAFQNVMNVNFWGVYNGVTAFLPYFKKQGFGHIVNISSVFGLWGIPTQAAYNCSKFAVRGLSESLAQELSGTGIKVSCVYPGGIRTNIAKSAGFNQSFGPFKDKETFSKLFDERLARTSPEKAALCIVRGIKANRARILIGPDAYLMDYTQRLFPRLYQNIIPAAIKLLGRK